MWYLVATLSKLLHRIGSYEVLPLSTYLICSHCIYYLIRLSTTCPLLYVNVCMLQRMHYLKLGQIPRNTHFPCARWPTERLASSGILQDDPAPLAGATLSKTMYGLPVVALLGRSGQEGICHLPASLSPFMLLTFLNLPDPHGLQ